MTSIVNPVTDKPLPDDAAEYVTKVRAVRRQSRKDARSGNPAKSMPAIKATAAAPRLILAVYKQEAVR